MPLITSKANGGSFGYGWSSPPSTPEALSGMVLLTPTSIDYSGTSASIGANGSVEFTAVTSLSLNGVFSADYVNYMVTNRSIASSSTAISARMRSAGTDATGTDYTYQYFDSYSSYYSGLRTTSDKCLICSASTVANGDVVHFYGPYLAQPTALRNTGISSEITLSIVDVTTKHNLSTQYDGFTIFPNSSITLSGLVSVYGLVGA